MAGEIPFKRGPYGMVHASYDLAKTEVERDASPSPDRDLPLRHILMPRRGRPQAVSTTESSGEATLTLTRKRPRSASVSSSMHEAASPILSAAVWTAAGAPGKRRQVEEPASTSGATSAGALQPPTAEDKAERDRAASQLVESLRTAALANLQGTDKIRPTAAVLLYVLARESQGGFTGDNYLEVVREIDPELDADRIRWLPKAFTSVKAEMAYRDIDWLASDGHLTHIDRLMREANKNSAENRLRSLITLTLLRRQLQLDGLDPIKKSISNILRRSNPHLHSVVISHYYTAYQKDFLSPASPQGAAPSAAGEGSAAEPGAPPQ